MKDGSTDFQIVVDDVTIYCDLTVPSPMVRIAKIKHPKLSLRIHINHYNTVTGGDHLMYSLKSTDQVDLSFVADDPYGNPTTVESATWSSSDASILTVTVNPTDFTMATAAAVGPAGTAQVTLSCDARFGPDISTILGLLEVTVVPGEAVTIQVTPGTAVPKPTPTPAP